MRTIDTVPEIVRRPALQCSLIGALEAILKAHGETYDYVDLMGLSGAAFRVRLARSSWGEIMGGRIHPGVSTDASFGPHVEAAMAATGYGHCVLGRFPQGDTPLAEAIRQEIDAGRPLLACNLCGGSEWGVVCGYDEDRRSAEGSEGQPGWLLCRTLYDEPGAEPAPPLGFPTDLWSVARRTPPEARDAAVRDSLGLAVDLLSPGSSTARSDCGWFWHYEPEYATGLAAYDAWIADLADERGLASLPEDQSLMYWQGTAAMYAQLLDARDAASRYLARVGPSLPDGSREAVLRAGAVFGDMVREMVAAWDCVPFRRGGYVHENGWRLVERTTEFLGRLVPPYADGWTPEMRKGTIAALRSARDRDSQALALLEAWRDLC